MLRCLPLVSICLLIATYTSAAEIDAPSTPTPEQILSTLKKSHPRVIVPAERFEELKQEIKTDETLARWHRKLKSKAEEILEAAPSKYEIPDGKRLLRTSRRVVDRVTTLALLYRLDGDQRYVDRAWKELQAAAAFKDWNPSHFLDTAEMTHAFAVGYDWLYDQWTTEQKATLKNAIIELGLKPGLMAYRGEARWGWFYRSQHNWNQVCNGGLTAGALAIADEEPEVAGEILASAIKSVPRAMQHYAPDGAWGEGPGYWHYATRYNVSMLAALESALGTDYGLSKIPGFSEAGSFPAQMSGPTGVNFNYADSGAGHIRAWELFWLSHKFDRPDFAAYQIAAAVPDPLDLVFYDPRGHEFDRTQTTLDQHFRGTEVATFRSDWHDPRALWIAFKAGSNAVNHSNLDIGTFVLEANGKRWFVDLGADNYNLPAYFGDKRWTYYRLRAEAHNTLLINPGMGPDQDPKASTKIVEFQGGLGIDSPRAALDLTAAYEANAARVRRTITMRERRYVLIRDEIETKDRAEIWSFLHTPAEIKLDQDARGATLALDGETLTVQLTSPVNAKLKILPAAPLPTSPNPPNQRSNGSIRKLAVHLSDVTDVTIELKITP